MRNRCSCPCLWAFVVALSGALCLVSAQTNLVKNGDMSQFNPKTKLPSYWLRPDWSEVDSLLKITADSTIFHTAAPSLKLLSTGLSKTGTRMIGQQITPVPKGQTIHVSVWVKDEGVAHAGFDFAVQAGKFVNGVFQDFGWIKVYSVGVSPNDWYHAQKDILIDPTATTLYVYAGIWEYSPTGTAWVDDVEVTCPNCPSQVLFRWGSGQRSDAGVWKDGTLGFPQSTSYRLTVLDASGRTVASSAGRGQTLTISTGNLAAGTYLAKVSSLRGAVVGKLVVER